MEVVPGTVKTTYHKWQDLLIPRHVPGSQGASGIIPRLEVLNLAVDMQEVAGKKALGPLDIIFSCCICQDTPSRIYEEPDDRLALRQNKDRQWGRIAKLYLTGCAHVVCTKHFEGGGMYSRGSVVLSYMLIESFHSQASHSTRWSNARGHHVRIVSRSRQATSHRSCMPSRGPQQASMTEGFLKHTSI